jgi:tRNA (guanine37-N1)-methyltransferase
MRIDVISIFPDYLAPLSLSLAGKAQASGVLDFGVHDLRQWTHDRHNTVDDTPYGGGAGMVMRPEPWGEAIDAVTAGSASPVLIVPTPSGRPFTQTLAAELSGESHLVFACGRYEGIDQRVMDHYAGRFGVVEVSLGDYVLNGGEVAALVMIEAVARLLPGFMGNPESLAEESHGESGLLEYPVYTKPSVWRDLQVPEVLLSGDHGGIAAWRHDQAVRRTAERRPDLAHPSRRIGGLDGGAAVPADAGQILTVERSFGVPASDPASVHVVARAGERIVASAACGPATDGWTVSSLACAPDLDPLEVLPLVLEAALERIPAVTEAVWVRLEHEALAPLGKRLKKDRFRQAGPDWVRRR